MRARSRTVRGERRDLTRVRGPQEIRVLTVERAGVASLAGSRRWSLGALEAAQRLIDAMAR